MRSASVGASHAGQACSGADRPPDWFQYLPGKPGLDEVNFWAPSPRAFRALTPGEFFLFRLHAPYRTIVGGGIFARADTLPCWLAWDAFQETNGAGSLAQMRARIARYRTGPPDDRTDFLIGCRILTQPFFLDESDWFEPPNWPPHFQGFKTYSTETSDGLMLWETARSHFDYGSSHHNDAPRFIGGI